MALLSEHDQPTTSRLNQEVTPMQLATANDADLDRTGNVVNAVATLTALTALPALADVTQRVSDEQLPCRVNDPELFFADSPADVEYAKSLCTTCPVRLDCLNGALERREPWGVWGGEWFVQGVVVPRKRPRGRPRKSEVAA
jgi:WhiB family transcriptional regulator, redox-sensing transcriptional regulator